MLEIVHLVQQEDPVHTMVSPPMKSEYFVSQGIIAQFKLVIQTNTHAQQEVLTLTASTASHNLTVSHAQQNLPASLAPIL